MAATAAASGNNNFQVDEPARLLNHSNLSQPKGAPFVLLLLHHPLVPVALPVVTA